MLKMINESSVRVVFGNVPLHPNSAFQIHNSLVTKSKIEECKTEFDVKITKNKEIYTISDKIDK